MFGWLDSGNMILNILVVVIGFLALIKGADVFVDGSASIARRFGVSGTIIGLTVVAMGTSAPELAVSVSAGVSGSNEIAVSNVVGSDIFNILMILGVCALLKPLPVDEGIKKRDFPVYFLGILLMILFSSWYILFGPKPDLAQTVSISGNVSRIAGIVLLLVFTGYMIFTIRVAKKTQEKDDDYVPEPLWKSILFILIGLACIVVGGDGVVNAAKNLAMMWGMSETLVGLTIVALGTSLPEFVTSIVAAHKGESGMALGNAVGSNIFNIFLILGVSSTIHPIPVTLAGLIDFGILLLVSAGAFCFVCSGKKMIRQEGAVLVLAYAGYMVYAILR